MRAEKQGTGRGVLSVGLLETVVQEESFVRVIDLGFCLAKTWR